MHANKRILLATIVLFTGLFSNIILSGTWQASFEHFASKTVLGQALWHLIPVAIVLLIFHPPQQLSDELGVNKNLLKAFGFAFLFTLPLLIGLAATGHINHQYSIGFLLVKTFKEGSVEELFFRAFLFGQLFRHCRWGFFPAAIVPAILFGIGHLYQGNTLLGSLAAFGITFLGAGWFSWLFAEWRYNIWLPIFMHFLMNFYWDLFSVGNGATGGFISNIARGITIFLSVYITIKLSKKQYGSLMINRKNLLRNTA